MYRIMMTLITTVEENTLHRYETHKHQYQHTLRLLALDPLSVVVVMVTSKVVAESWVDGAVLVEFTIQNVRQCTAVRRN